MAIFYTDTGSLNRLEVSGSTILSGSLIVSGATNFGPTGLTGSLLGTSSYATVVASISNDQINEALGGGSITTNDITASYIKVGVIPNGVAMSLTGSQEVTGSIFATDVIANTLLETQQLLVNGNAEFNADVIVSTLLDTTSPNKIVVVNTSTGKLFTTASVGGGGGTGTGFPYDGTVTPAVISGSLIISSSHNSPVIVSGSTDSFFEVEVVNFSAGNNASSDVVVSSNNTTDFGNYIDLGINSTTFNGPLVGGASDGYLYFTSSVGELDIGNASPTANGNVRLFAGGSNSTATTRMFISASGNIGINSSSNLQHQLTVNGNVLASAITASFTGPIVNISELSMAVSGTIPANGTTTVTLNLNQANYFSVSASAVGTVTWVVTNPPVAGRAQTFILEYTNGGIKTNSWFTNTRWPGGVAPSLTSASANPDILGFTTDDAGSNWRGVLLQRGSA